MMKLRPLFALALASLLLESACQTIADIEPIPTIRTNQLDVYEKINAGLDQKICILGKLNVDHQVIKFPLEEMEQDGVLIVSYARIITDISNDDAFRNRLRNGETRKICGYLYENPPYDNCSGDDCRRFELKNSRIES